MRRTVLVFALPLLGAACGEKTVADRIDALRRSDVRFVHAMLPSPQRMSELHPEAKDDWSTRGIERAMRANVHAAAILDAGQAAVPELVRLLGDPERGTLAAVFLGEIGGKEAAAALLARWRELRGDAKETDLYLYKDGQVSARGFRYEGVDGDLYGELIASLCYAARHVGAEVAADTSAAMDEAERLQRAGEKPHLEERRQEEGGELKLSWFIEPIETACEGLKVLAMAGAPQGVDLFVRALRSPVDEIRWEAIQYLAYLGTGLDRTLPVLGSLLDDPKWRTQAIEEVASLVLHEMPPKSASPAEEEAVAARYKRKLQELGHLPR